MVSLFIVSLLLFQINSKLCCFKDFKVSGGGSSKTENKNVSLDKMKDLNTVILPVLSSVYAFSKLLYPYENVRFSVYN